MIDVGETKPIEASLTIRLTGEDVDLFKGLLYRAARSLDPLYLQRDLINRLERELS